MHGLIDAFSVVSCVPSFRYCPGCIGEADPGTERNADGLARTNALVRAIWPARHRDPPRRDQPPSRCSKILRQRPASIEDSTGQHRLGLLCPKIGFFHRHIEGNQHRAGFDNLPGVNCTWLTVRLIRLREGNGAEGQHGPDRGRSLVMVNGPGHCKRDDFHRFRLVGRRSGLILDAAIFPHRQPDPIPITVSINNDDPIHPRRFMTIPSRPLDG